MIRNIRRGPATAAVLAVLLAVAAPASADPAPAALEARDAYVSPRVLGPAALIEERVLARAAAGLREAGRPVKLAVVRGPVGAPSLQAYADRLARRLGGEGTVVVTTPTRALAAATADPEVDLSGRLRGAGLDEVANPVERLVLAARLSAVEVDRSDGGGRAAFALVGIALLGGGWAAAVGTGREGRLQRQRLSESRARMRLLLDALRARAVALARRDDLSPVARGRVERALGTYSESVGALQEARGAEMVAALEPRVWGAIAELAGVARGAGVPFPPERPFEGLCAADPAHGSAAGEGRVAGREGPAPVCAGCREASEEGRPRARRLLPREGRPVPFDEIELAGG